MKFKMPPVDMRSARHVQMMLAAFASLFLLGLAYSASRGSVDGERNAFIGLCAYIVLIAIIEWRIHVDGFDYIFRSAKRLSKAQRMALVDFLTKED